LPDIGRAPGKVLPFFPIYNFFEDLWFVYSCLAAMDYNLLPHRTHRMAGALEEVPRMVFAPAAKSGRARRWYVAAAACPGTRLAATIPGENDLRHYPDHALPSQNNVSEPDATLPCA